MNKKLIVTAALLGTIPLVSSGSSIVHADTKDSSNSLIMAQANPGTDQNSALSNSVKEADYIFLGVVAKVEHRLSDGTPQLPHTFVTFKVEQLLKGQVNQQLVTLRFIGGPDNKGNFLSVSGVPLFDVGDRDILFVKNNGQSGCPLVECDEGRFRIINNKVYTEQGGIIQLNNQGKLVFGSVVPLEEVRTNKIGDTVVRDVFSSPSGGNDRDPSATGVVQSQNSPASLPSVNPSQLTGIIQNQLKQLATLGQLQTRSFVASVNIRQKFSVSSPIPAAPPPQTQAPQSKPSRITSEADRLELEALRRNGNNPVIPFIDRKP